jgi:hypothetical protein
MKNDNTHFIAQEIKNHLVQLAVEDKLPLDITLLNTDGIQEIVQRGVSDKPSYDFYLFCKLDDLMNPSETEYDLLFGIQQSKYEGFLGSHFNDENKSLYECIINYLENLKIN